MMSSSWMTVPAIPRPRRQRRPAPEICREWPLKQSWLDRYELEPYLLYEAIRRGCKVCEVPVTKYYPPDRSVGYTKMKAYRDWWRIVRPMLLLTVRIKH